jgi:hypothetical protein
MPTNMNQKIKLNVIEFDNKKFLGKRYSIYMDVSRPEYLFVYQYWSCPLLLVQVNIENHRIATFYVLTHLIRDSDAQWVTVSFFTLMPQIFMIQNNF